MVRVTGVEPARETRWILNPLRLPVPPYPRIHGGRNAGGGFDPCADARDQRSTALFYQLDRVFVNGGHSGFFYRTLSFFLQVFLQTLRFSQGHRDFCFRNRKGFARGPEIKRNHFPGLCFGTVQKQPGRILICRAGTCLKRRRISACESGGAGRQLPSATSVSI